MSPSNKVTIKPPQVLIVGAGLAGLFLAIALQKANIPFEIYERSKFVRPLGGIMALNAGIFPALEQLGVYEELLKISIPSVGFNIYSGDMSEIALLKTEGEKELIGYDRVVFARPEFYQLLLSKVPSERIHYNKKVVSVIQTKDDVTISCADGTSYNGDILVGADGAYSGVRQEMFKQMQEENVLPVSDTQELNKGYVCMVGTTCPLDPTDYPGLDAETSSAYQIIGKNTHYSWSAFSVLGNRIGWNVVSQLATLEQSAEAKFGNAEWGPEANEAMIKDVKDFLIPFSNTSTMGDLINATPAENISRVFLEDKLFDSWHHGRVVLIGDACHKLLPSSGQGAVTSMQDAVVLASHLYDLTSLTSEGIQEAFQAYRKERFPHVKEQYEASKINAKLIYGQTFLERCARYLIFNYMPISIQAKASSKGMAYRPQVSFLPLVPNLGSSYVIPQKLSKRYEESLKANGSTIAV
ncbi:hypothetical protein BKA57DRAFT_503384 [Linnemannia elongata]|nr:hypothetical protein BKA57DRAFT_503384 [Linnemannia elongata]